MTGLKILLVDDHAVVRAGYRLLLTQCSRIEEVREATGGEQACQVYSEWCADVVVMDLSMPGIGGLEAIRRIRLRDSSARVLVFSIHDEPVYLKKALSAGASGYITKSSAADILVGATLAVADGETYVESGLGSIRGAPAGRDSPVEHIEQLSTREFDVFLLLARGFTVREISEELHLSYKTVANYNTAIKSKLGVATSAEMARLAIQKGLFQN